MSPEKDPLAGTSSPPLFEPSPPAYETLNLSDARRKSADHGPIHLPNSPPAFRPPNATPKSHNRSLSSSSVTSLQGKKSWFKFSSPTPASSSRTLNEVRTTILGLVRDLVQEHSSGSPAALGILSSCAEACSSHTISLSAILQEKFIESHSPLYWAIVKRPKPNTSVLEDLPEEPDLVGALLSRSAPLNEDTISELRLACLATSDQPMFQRLRHLPQFSAIRGADQILLGTDIPPDEVTVEIGPGVEGAFSANFQIHQFHKRMMISKEIALEFIARNRIWRFALLITPDNAWSGPPPGSWCASLSLQEPSPPTWLDARLVLHEPPGEDIISGTAARPTQGKSIPTLRLKAKQMLEAPRTGVPATKIVVSLDDDPTFTNLQYSGSSAEEILSLRLEGKLRKPALDE